MRWITIKLMEYSLRLAIKKQEKETNSIFKSAYKNLIKNYEDTIMFLKAERNNY